jgi:Glycosyltransferase family 87
MTIYFCVLLTAVCVFFMTAYVKITWESYKGQTPEHLPLYGDFFALWSYSKIGTLHPVAELYDFAKLHMSQIELGMDPDLKYPFPYPPTFIFLIWPLSLLQYDVGYQVWTLGTLALFVWVVRKTCSRRLFFSVAIIISPATTTTIFAGQSGFFAAALMTAGFRLAKSRPIVAGILLGLLSYKPQLGLLVPIALVAAELWVVIGAACVTVVVMAAAATLAFGWGIWQAWLSMLPAYADMFDAATIPLRARPTVLANLQMLGVSLPLARGAQGVVGVVVACFVWRCFRRDSGRLAAAALLVGTFLSTPHAFYYDLPMVLAGMVLFIEDRLETTATFGTAEILILALAIIFPVLMLLKDLPVPIGALSLLLLFGLIVRQQGRTTNATRATHLLAAAS